MSDLEAALEPIAGTLEADGYRLEARQTDGRLSLRIEAGPEACADCLVPKPMLAKMIAQRLAPLGLDPTAVDLRYPGE